MIRKKLLHLVTICTVITWIITWSPSLSDAKAIRPLTLGIQRAKRTVEARPSSNATNRHDEGHGEDHANCAVTEHILAETFSILAEELDLVGEDGTVCEIEHEEHYYDDNHTNSSNSCETYFEFVQQLLIRLNVTTPCCLGNTSNCEDEPTGSSRTSLKEAYGYGFLMVLLISLCSLLGVLFVPLLTKNNSWGKILYQYIYALMIALGASALFCDAILHLIPEVFGLHGHSAEDGGHGDHEHGEDDLVFISKGCVVIGGLYAFFLFEFIVHTWNAHSHHHGDTDSGGSSSTAAAKSETETNSPSTRLLKGENDQTKKYGDNCDENVLESSHSQATRPKSFPMRIRQYIRNIKPFAWLILLGDGVHNFADGLALGAAISQSLSLGIGTMIAILFHEIPHEISDFVILISTGMTWYAALLLNFFSALLAIVGFFVGVAVSVESSEANEWILAAAAGLFIYVALVDLLPELIHLKQKGCLRWGLFLVLNVVFFISFVVLLLLAIYEDQLNDLVNVN